MLAVSPVMLVTDESCISWYSELHRDGIPSLKWHISLGSLSSPFSSNVNVSTMGMLDLHQITPPSSFSTTDYLWARDGAVIICFTSGLFAYCSFVPHWGSLIGRGHVNGWSLPCLNAQVRI